MLIDGKVVINNISNPANTTETLSFKDINTSSQAISTKTGSDDQLIMTSSSINTTGSGGSGTFNTELPSYPSLVRETP